jgi:hypothetical protein
MRAAKTGATGTSEGRKAEEFGINKKKAEKGLGFIHPSSLILHPFWRFQHQSL